MTAIKSSVTLQRSDDRGETCEITFSFEQGMPDMLTVTQRVGGKVTKVSMTSVEATVFRYIMNEFDNFKRLKDDVLGEYKKEYGTPDEWRGGSMTSVMPSIVSSRYL